MLTSRSLRHQSLHRPRNEVEPRHAYHPALPYEPDQRNRPLAPRAFPADETHLPVLVVSSSFNGTTIYLYATNFIHGDWTDETMRNAAILAANAYCNRWQIEVLFQDIKEAFAIEQARVRTFRRLTNLIAIATLAFVYFAHHLPQCSDETTKLLKLMKDNQQAVLLCFRTFVSSIRNLLSLAHTRYITGRPRKEKPPDPPPFLPNFPL